MSRKQADKQEGLKEIEVPCMKCEKAVKVMVAEDYTRRMRKFCFQCKKIHTMHESTFMY
jgi:hypothetical protein